MNKDDLNPKQQRKRQKIIDVAIKLFVKFGIQGTSMQLLAKRADVATGSIYNYFDNKEALIKEIFHFLVDEERDYMLIDYNKHQSIRQRFEHLIRRSISFKAKYPDKLKFRQKYVNSASVINEIRNGEVYTNHPFEDLGKEAVEKGIFKPLPLEELFYFGFSGMTGFVTWHLYKHDNFNEQDMQNAIDLVWDALCVHERSTDAL